MYQLKRKVLFYNCFLITFIKSLKESVWLNYINIPVWVSVYFHMDFKIEDYLCTIKDLKLMKCISKFRLNNHGLQLKKVRYMYIQPKTPENERICLHYNLQIRNELHFLLLCPFYDNERSGLLNVINNITFNIILRTGLHIKLYYVRDINKTCNAHTSYMYLGHIWPYIDSRFNCHLLSWYDNGILNIRKYKFYLYISLVCYKLKRTVKSCNIKSYIFLKHLDIYLARLNMTSTSVQIVL